MILILFILYLLEISRHLVEGVPYHDTRFGTKLSLRSFPTQPIL